VADLTPRPPIPCPPGARPVASDRYHHDARFHALVDSIASVLSDGRFTPDELRDALTLAVSISEGHRVPYCRVSR
jgi:hypothetical protein